MESVPCFLQLASWTRGHSHDLVEPLSPKLLVECVLRWGEKAVARVLVVVLCQVSLAHYFFNHNFYYYVFIIENSVFHCGIFHESLSLSHFFSCSHLSGSLSAFICVILISTFCM